jgi:hypothetical protein
MMFTPEFSGIKMETPTMAVFLNPHGHKTPYGEFPEVSTNEWPEPHWIARPRDEIGEAIVEFAKKWRGHPGLADGPFDPRTGRSTSFHPISRDRIPIPSLAIASRLMVFSTARCISLVPRSIALPGLRSPARSSRRTDRQKWF